MNWPISILIILVLVNPLAYGGFGKVEGLLDVFEVGGGLVDGAALGNAHDQRTSIGVVDLDFVAQLGPSGEIGKDVFKRHVQK